MKKIFLLAAMLLAAPFLPALDLVSGGRSQYSIYALPAFKDAAKLVQECIKKRTGVTLPIVKSAAGVKTPLIRIGMAPAGVDTGKFDYYEYVIAVRNKDIYLAGYDGRVSDGKGRFMNCSNKAAVEFCKKFTGTDFFFPGAAGRVTPKGKNIVIPDDFFLREKTAITEVRSRNSELFYDLANNFYPGSWYRSYGGHSHPVAVPFKKYFKKHPEYFAIVGGKRYTWRPQYCISNPEVQELIYKEILRGLSRGVTTVQLGQSDGFKPCECQKCKDLFGVKDYGEKLWILHRGFAERLYKEKPDKKVCIIAYGPTARPPQTFKKFPPNVMVELAPLTERSWKNWKDFPVPQGFYCYLYNWGNYKLAGFTPRLTMQEVAAQTRLFKKAGVQGIYRCGFGELWGLEGPIYYIWGQMLKDPGLSPEKLLKEYCIGVFGPAAAGYMEEFYKLIDSRIDKVRVDNDVNWDTVMANDGKRSNFALLTARYPKEVRTRMQELVRKCEKNSKSPAAAAMLGHLKVELANLCYTVEGIEQYLEFTEKQDRASFEKLAKTVSARWQLLDSLPRRKDARKQRVLGKRNEMLFFGGEQFDRMIEGGRLRGPLYTPFTWDTRWMLKNNIQPVFRYLKYGEYSLLVQGYNGTQNPGIAGKPVRVRCTKDDANLYLDLELSGYSPERIKKSSYELFVGRGKELYHILNARGGLDARRLVTRRRTALNKDNKERGDRYELITRKSGVKVLFKIPDSKVNGVRFIIPWSRVGGKPDKGEKLNFNVMFTSSAPSLRYVWNHNIYQKRYFNVRDLCGTLGE